jgi:hypothetical protein
MSADGSIVVPLDMWRPSEHEIAFGPAVHPGSAILARWVEVAADALFARFGGTPAWFVADWERARTWAFPVTFEPPHMRIVNGQEFCFARATAPTLKLFAEMMRSPDVAWDALAVMDGSLVPADVTGLIAPWQQAIEIRTSTLAPAGDVMFTSGDGSVLRWANAQLDEHALRAAVLAIPGVAQSKGES